MHLHGTIEGGSPARRGAARLWFGWITATITGELLGLMLVALVGAAIAIGLGEPAGVYTMVAVAAMVLAGAVEGAAVGFVQSLVLRRRIPHLRPFAWVRATAAGAAACWAIGMAGSVAASNVGAGAAPPRALAMALTVVGGGVVLGALLGGAQWLVLRRFIRHAGWWIAANALAWAAGLAVAFAGASAVGDDARLIGVAMVGAVSGAATGLVVGAITGIALVLLLRADGAGDDAAPGG